MNFLAHAYLSFGSEPILIGNMIADFVKGKQFENFAEPIKKGILLHRAIDEFTDAHLLVKEAQNFLKPNFKRYSTVITDMYFDHLLAKLWSNYHEIPLKIFSKNVYLTLRNNEQILPERFLMALHFMEKDDWLSSYSEIEGLQIALTNMAKRTRFDSQMQFAHLTFTQHKDYFQQIFLDFFQDLIQFSKSKFQAI
jgi:acyl carrier protein phosphodiesterase